MFSRTTNRAINGVFLAIPILLSLAWLASVVYALQTCSMFPQIIGHPCKAEEGDIWMGPFIYAAIGIPATFVSLSIAVWALLRKFPGAKR
jgi:hypothetical protein